MISGKCNHKKKKWVQQLQNHINEHENRIILMRFDRKNNLNYNLHRTPKRVRVETNDFSIELFRQIEHSNDKIICLKTIDYYDDYSSGGSKVNQQPFWHRGDIPNHCGYCEG